MRQFVDCAYPSSGYERRVEILTDSLRIRVNPKLRKDDPSVNLALNAFASDGSHPSAPGRSMLAQEVQERITRDLRALLSAGGNPDLVRKLCIAGTWMFAAMPEGVREYLVWELRAGRMSGVFTQGIGRALANEGDVRAAFSFLHERLLERRVATPIYKSAMNDLKAAAQILQYRERAAHWLETDQAETIAEAALHTIKREIEEGETLQQAFLWGATAFLLTLRHRAANAGFLVPLGRNGPRGQLYTLAEGVLDGASRVIAAGRPCHRFAPQVVAAARAFLDKSGGNPDIIKVVTQELT